MYPSLSTPDPTVTTATSDYTKMLHEFNVGKQEAVEMETELEEPITLFQVFFEEDPSDNQVRGVNCLTNLVACAGTVVSALVFMFGISIHYQSNLVVCAALSLGIHSSWTVYAAFMYVPFLYLINCLILKAGHMFKMRNCYVGYIAGAVPTFFALMYFGYYFAVHHPVLVVYGPSSQNIHHVTNVKVSEYGIILVLLNLVGAFFVAFSVPIVNRASDDLQEQAAAQKPIKIGSSELIIMTVS